MDWPSGRRHVGKLNDLIKYDGSIVRDVRTKRFKDIERTKLTDFVRCLRIVVYFLVEYVGFHEREYFKHAQKSIMIEV